MTKIMHAVIAAAASILLLAGCSSVSAEPAAKIAPVPSASSAADAPITVTPATPMPSTGPTSGMIPNGEKAFLKLVRDQTFGLDSITDAQLLSAGHYTCEQLAAGGKRINIVAIKGASGTELTPGQNNALIMLFATQTLCVEYNNDASFSG